MTQQEPQIFDLDPDKAPRTSAVILVLCGMLGLGFMLVNVVFTGEEPLHTPVLDATEDGPIQGRASIMPNLVRGPRVDGVAEEEVEVVALEEENRAALKARKAKATTGPAPVQFQFGAKPAAPAAADKGISGQLNLPAPSPGIGAQPPAK